MIVNSRYSILLSLAGIFALSALTACGDSGGGNNDGSGSNSSPAEQSPPTDAVTESPPTDAVTVQETEEKIYSTPPDYAENVYFGDAHIHTALSVDAALWGTSLRPEDAYRYARGEELTSFKGWKTKLKRPLEWTVVADHSHATLDGL